jgi:C1A family cysteine protease
MSNTWYLGFGWSRDLPDHRDFTPDSEAAVEALSRLPSASDAPQAQGAERPAEIDWREYCPAACDRQGLPTSVAHACVGLVQYFERRANGRLVEPSRLFVHSNAQRLLSGDSPSGAHRPAASVPGITLRAAWRAIRRFGLPPETLWPYCAENIDREPGAFAYSFRDDSNSISYLRLDGRDRPGPTVVDQARSFLAAGFCLAMGVSLHASIGSGPDISFPSRLDPLRAAEAVMAVGYDDRRRIRSEKGALLVRAAWGPAWGDGGYGWLPYTYLREGLAADVWTLLSPAWLASGEFYQPADLHHPSFTSASPDRL